MSALITPDMALDDQKALSGINVLDDDVLNLNGDDSEKVMYEEMLFTPFKFDSMLHESSTLTALENAVTDLSYLADSIRSAKGMNQTFAMEAERLLPGFGGVPVGYYTKVTSATRFKISLEEISKGVWGLIVAAGVALVAMLVKFIKWLFGDKKDSKNTTDNKPNTTPEEIKKLEDLSKDVMHDIETRDKAFSGILKAILDELENMPKKEYPYKDIDGLLEMYCKEEGADSALAKILNEEIPLFTDLLKGGEYFKTMSIAVDKLGDVLEITKKVVRGIETLNTSVEDEYKKLSLYDNKPDFEDMDGIAIKYPLPDSDVSKLSHITDISAKIKEVRDKVAEETSHGKLTYTKLNELFSHNLYTFAPKLHKVVAEINELEPLLGKAVEDVEKNIKLVEKSRDAATKKAGDSGVDVRISLYAKSALNTLNRIGKDLGATFVFVSLVKEYAELVVKLWRNIVGINAEIIRVVNAELDKGEGVPPEIAHIHEQLLEKIKEVKKV